MARTTVWRAIVAGIGLGLVGAAAGVMPACVVVVGNTTNRYDEEWYDRAGGRSSPRTIGIYTEPVGPALASQIGVDADRCTLVTGVIAGRPADRAGLRRYDVITTADGCEPVSPGRLREIIRAKAPGDTLTLRVIRNGQPMDVVVTLDTDQGKGYSG